MIAPFRATLDRHRVRLIVLHASGALRRIPLSILHDGTSYLAEHFAVVMQPNASRIGRRSGLTRPVRAASIAVPTAPGMDPLPATTADTQALRQVLADTGYGVVETAGDAPVDADRLEALWARRPTLIHISSHFEASDSDASRSAFVLADGSRYTLARLARQDLSGVELALMLGCGTQALSEVGGAMGITAVDTLLLRMGVGTVLGTAWSVDDHVAHTFLQTFLKSVFVSQLDLAESMRLALAETARDPLSGRWRHPHEWGAFVLSGDWTGIR